MERVRYPCGVRFVPTEYQLVVDYLINKQKGETLPTACVKECRHIYGDKSLSPWDLLDENSDDGSFYAFTKLKKSSRNDGIDRTAGCGFWKDEHTSIGATADRTINWWKKEFVFETKNDGGSGGHCNNGEWVMVEFSLLNQKEDDYVLCKISNIAEEPKKKKRCDEVEVVINPSVDEIQCNHELPAAGSSELPPEEVGDQQILHQEKKMMPASSPNSEEVDNSVANVDVDGKLPFSSSSNLPGESAQAQEHGVADSTEEQLQNAFGGVQQQATTAATASPDSQHA